MCINRQVSCPSLSAPANGFIEIPCMAFAGGKCSFACATGYSLSGSSSVDCLDTGQWSGPVPACVPGGTSSLCGPLFPPPGGRTLSACLGKANEVCTFACEPGYTLVGAPTLTCQSTGVWSGTIPTCAVGAGCPDIPIPTNGYTEGTCVSAKEGQTCVFGCTSGTTLVGPNAITCRAGGWDGSPPRCEVASCPNLTPPENGRLSGVCSPGRYNQQCIVTCNTGYVSPFGTVITCTDRGWSNNFPRCDPTYCPAVQNIENGFTEGQCNPGINSVRK